MPHAIPSVEGARQVTAGGRRLRLLVLDDEPSICEWLTRALAPYGYDVLACTHPDKAACVLATRPIDGAVLDVRLAGSSGLDVLEYIRATAALAPLPVVILTGVTPLSEGEDARIRRNSAHVVYKPEGADALVATLSRLMQQDHAIRRH